MSGLRQIEGGRCGAPNVVRLPTSASCSVKQPRDSRAKRRAVDELPQFPMERTRYQRERANRHELVAMRMLETTNSAVMQMALAVFTVMENQQKIRVKGRLIALSALNRPGAANAMAWIEYEDATKGEKRAIDAAGAELAREGY